MSKLKTAHEIEIEVLNYLSEKVAKGYNADFNPLNLSKNGIANALNLSIEEVQEAIAHLSVEETSGEKTLKRVESVEPQFDIWLPCNDAGKEIKNKLCESGMAVRESVYKLYSFFIIVIFYYFTFEKPYLTTILELKNPEQYFFWGTMITALSIPVGKYLSQKWEEINELLQKVKGLKNYIWILIITISLILFFIKQGYEVGIILSGFAILLNIFLLVFQLINKSK